MKKFKFTHFKKQLPLLITVWCMLTGFLAGAQTYTRSVAAANALVPMLAPTTIYLGDDGVSASIPILMNFPYYGGNYNAITIGNNGFLRFAPNVGAPGFTNGAITAGCGTANTNTVFALWDDWNSAFDAATSAAPGVNFGTNIMYGAIAGGGFAVQWNVQGTTYLGGTSGNNVAFQAVLRSNGNIEIIYNDINIGTGAGNNGATATVGINGNNTGECDQFSFNTAIPAGTGTITYTRSTLIQTMVATPVLVCAANGATYSQPVTVTFAGTTPLLGTVFQVCYQTGCAPNQPSNSALLASPYVCQTFAASGAATQLVTLSNVPCNASGQQLYGTYGPTGPSQPIYIGCLSSTVFGFNTPAGLPCTLVCPTDRTYYLESLECCAPAAYDLLTAGNCALPFSIGPITSLTTARNTGMVTVSQSVTGGATASVTGNIIQLNASSTTSSANVSLLIANPGQIVLSWAYSTVDGSQFDPFVWQLIRAGVPVATGGTVGAGTAPQNGVINVPVLAGDVLSLTQLGDFSVGGTSTTVTFQSITAAGLVQAVVDVVSGPEPGECVPIGVNVVVLNLINPFTGMILETCTFDITVVEAPASGSLVCNDHVNVSLSDDCEALIEPDDVLEGSQYRCADNYEVAVSKGPNGPWTTPALVNQNHCGNWYYRVRDLSTGNSCWGTLTVEDKLAPVLECGSCGGALSGVIETTDTPGDFSGFGASPIPAPGGTCGAGLFTPTDFVSFTLPSTSSGTYTFHLTGSVPVTGANFNSQLGITLYTGIPDPLNSCTNAVRQDGQSLNPVTTTINNHFTSVALTPGTTYWLGIQMPRHALGAAVTFPNAWTVDVIDDATGLTVLVGPDNCAVDCIDKAALLNYIATKNLNGITNILGIPAPTILGGYCGGNPVWDYKLKGDFSNNCGGYIVMEWTLKETCGRQTSIECRVAINPMVFGDVNLPEGVDDVLYIECKDGISPEDIEAKYGVIYAWPYFIDAAGNPIRIQNSCNFFSSYSDIVLDACAPHCHGNKKIIRRWTILDWCEGELQEATQIIKAVDQTPPTFILKDTMVSTRPWDCTGDFYLPHPWELHDNCDADPKYEVVAPEGIWVVKTANGWWRASNVPVGTTTFTYVATDCCGNRGISTLDVVVMDRTPPVAVAKRDIVVSLVPGYDAGGQTDGQAKIFTYHVDNGSFDNCTGVDLEVRRPVGSPSCGNEGLVINPNTGERHNNNVTFSNRSNTAPYNVNDTDGGDFVKFCCADLTTAGADFDGDGVLDTGYHQVILRVWDDGNGSGIYGDVVNGKPDNWNETWANVKVECKIPPIITCPFDNTIYCDWAIPTNVQSGTPGQDNSKAIPVTGLDFIKTGLPTAYGVCVNPVITFWDREFFDQCDLGFILRTFIVKDKGFITTCIQRIDVLNSLVQNPWVFLPSSLSTTPIPLTGPEACEGPTEAQIKERAPKYTAGPCDVIGVSTKVWQFDFEEGVCRKWKVEYKYVNWCTLEERGPYYKYFIFEDLIPPVYTDCRDTMYAVGPNCDVVVKMTKTAVDTSGCINNGWLKWEVYVDLWADGTDDYLFSSFYAGADGALRVINGNPVAQYKLTTGSISNAGADGATRSGEELVITLPFPIAGKMSNHKVAWKVTDGCHNFTTCHENFMVVDKKPPTPVCVPLSTALMADPDGSGPALPMVELWAVDFIIKAFDNCTEEDDILFTFENVPPQVTNKVVFGRTINIDVPHYFNATGGLAAFPAISSSEKAIEAQYLRGENGIQLWNPLTRSSAKVWTSLSLAPDGSYADVDVKVTVWDKKFNYDFCWTTLKLICNVCPTGNGSRIAGTVATGAGQPVTNVTVTVDAPIVEFPKSVFTSANGQFFMDNLARGLSYGVSASKGGDYSNGVSTLDLVMIQRHILAIEKLDSPYKLIAADANHDGKITASDLTDLRKLILGITNELPSNTSWRFPVKAQTLDVTNPFPFVETISIASLGDPLENQDFVAVKIGDVNGNVSTNVSNPITESRVNNNIGLVVSEKAVEAGETVEVPVTAANFNDVYGYQFTMNLNGAGFVGIQSGAIEVNANNVGVLSTDVMTMSFASNESVTVRDNEVLFTLILKANKGGNVSQMMSLNSNVTATESYVGRDLNVGKVSLQVRTAPVADATIELLQNEPNPFKGQTTVSFRMPTAAKATISIYDVTGKLVTVRPVDGVKGFNSEIFTREQLGTSGVLYYTLVSGDFTATKKMIIIE